MAFQALIMGVRLSTRVYRPLVCSSCKSKLRSFSSSTQSHDTAWYRALKSRNLSSAKYAQDLIDNSRSLFLKKVTLQRAHAIGFSQPNHTISVLRYIILKMMYTGLDPRLSAEHMLPNQRKDSYFGETVLKTVNAKDQFILSDVPALSEILYLVGEAAFIQENRRIWDRFGFFTLGIAVELGHEQAAIKLWRLESLKSDNQITGTVHTVVKRLAQSRNDWRAMSVYVDYQLKNRSNPAIRKEAYEIAKDLYEMIEPGAADPGHLRPQDKYEPPWKLLRDASDQYLYDLRSGPEYDEVQEVYDRATREGTTKFSDPEACIHLAGNLSIKEDTTAWLDLKTKAAMAGDNESSYDIGKYWLQKDGWYPCSSKEDGSKSLTAENQVGFDWMEVAASGSTSAQVIASRYLSMALVLRENGLVQHGREYLEKGMQRLEEEDQKRDIGAETWIGKLAEFARNWNDSFSANAAQLLGEPFLK